MNYLAMCAVESCRASRRTHPTRSFYKFPKDPVMFDKWKEKCQFKIKIFPKTLRICEKHFNRKSVGKTRLLKNAIPEYYLKDPYIKVVKENQRNVAALSARMKISNKLNHLEKMLKFYKKQNNLLKSIIQKQEPNKSVILLINSIPNMSSKAKEFGETILKDSTDWPCVKCVDMVKDGAKLREADSSERDDTIKLEVNKAINEITTNLNLGIDENSIHESDDTTSLTDAQQEECSSHLDSVKTDVDEENSKDNEIIKDAFSTQKPPHEKYGCEKCNVKRNTYKQLISHLSFHSDVNLFECERCGKEFHRRSTYRTHARIYQLERPHVCKICGKDFKAPVYLKRHQFSHLTEKTVPCPKCDRMFCHRQALHVHYLSAHKAKNKACKLCNAQFKFNAPLKYHMSRVHGDKSNDATKSNPTKSNEQTKSEKVNEFACEKCGKLFSSESTLRCHIKNIHHKDRPFSCSYCSKSFIFAQFLEHHMQFHINEKNSPVDPITKEKYLKYKCDVCDKSFTAPRILKHHKIQHTGAKDHSCIHCGKMFALSAYLNRHIRLIHNTKHPHNFTCSTCGKVSIDISHHKSHMLSHSGEAPFACKFCDSTFRYNKSLKLHVSNKHKTEII